MVDFAVILTCKKTAMSGNTIGTLFTVTSFGESHGPAIGCVVDGCPPGLAISEGDIQAELDRRRPGTSRHVTQRREPDAVEILSGVFGGRTTGAPIGLLIRNQDQRSKDYGNIAETFRPGHADYVYTQKYGFRDYRGGGRSSARETAVRVAAGAIARKWLAERYGVRIVGWMSQLGPIEIPFLNATDIAANAFGKTPLDHERYDYYYNSEILPKIFFGDEKAKIVTFHKGYIEVIAPKHPKGKVNVYLLNNDGGISNKIPFTFETAPVTIKSMVPNAGTKEGGTIAHLEGTGFAQTEIEVYKDGYYNGISEIEKKAMPLVRFGNITATKDLAVNKADVELTGGLKVEYNGNTKTLVLTIQDKKDGPKYTKTIQGYDSNEKYIPVQFLKADGKPYDGKELIKVNIEGERIGEDQIIKGKLVVERGYAPATTYINTQEIRVDSTPSYHTVGKNIPVFVINPDGGKGEAKYEYTNPDSNPRIHNIRTGTRQPVLEKRPELDASSDVLILKINRSGENIITVEGVDFRPNATIQMSSLVTRQGSDVTLEGTTALKFKMPKLPESSVGKVYPLLVQNEDKASHSSDQRIPKIFIEIVDGETNPEILSVEPQKGPATGGTKVTITGKDLRNEMKNIEGKLIVSFGEIEARQISYYRDPTDGNVKIEVIAPKQSTQDKVEIKIDNPDSARTQDGIFFQYISKPTIDTVSPNKLFTNDTKTEVTLTGTMFKPGAKVIVGGKIVDKKDIKPDMNIKGEGIIGVDPNGINREVGVVGGVEAATVTFVNDKTIKLTFGENKDLDNSSLIIINPDGGISDPYDKFQYQKPLPTRPLILEGIPGQESTVQLIWSKSDESILNKATLYEIYGRKTTDKENSFIGSTKNAEFLVKGLERETQYTFMVRALNEHGASLDFATVTVKTLGIRQDEQLREKEEKLKEEEKKIRANGKEEIKDGRLNITLGTNRFRGGAGTLDLTLAKYKNQDKVTILIPIELARKDNKLTIKDGTMTTAINARDLYTLSVSKQDKGNDDAYLRIHLDKTVESHLPRGKRAASKAYELSFDYIYERDTILINQLLRPGTTSLEQDLVVYPNNKNTSIYSFNEELGSYEKLGSKTTDIKGRTKLILLSDR